MFQASSGGPSHSLLRQTELTRPGPDDGSTQRHLLLTAGPGVLLTHGVLRGSKPGTPGGGHAARPGGHGGEG